MKLCSLVVATAALVLAFANSAIYAQAPASPAQIAQSQASSHGKYGFLLFYRNDDDATRAMAQAVADFAATRPDVALIHVQITDAAEASLVRQFNVERAPMPLTIATAPNGAVTGAYPLRVTSEQLAASFVTPAMSHCMKSMQQGRFVFLCVQSTPQAVVPAGVAEFVADSHFKDRSDVVNVNSADPAEAQLLAELSANPSAPNGVSTVFFAPPGVLVGKFTSFSTKSEIAGALHKAGKCCDDPHCKHNHAAQPKSGSVR